MFIKIVSAYQTFIEVKHLLCAFPVSLDVFRKDGLIALNNKSQTFQQTSIKSILNKVDEALKLTFMMTVLYVSEIDSDYYR